MDGTKVLSLVFENLNFFDSLNFLPMSLKGMPKSFEITCKKRYYTQVYNTAEKFVYEGRYPKPKFYGQSL